jgi:hypothetical protein
MTISRKSGFKALSVLGSFKFSPAEPMRSSEGGIMNIPAASDPKWRDVITGKLKPQFEFMGINVLVCRVVLSAASNPSPDNISKGIAELRSMFEKNIAIPKVQSDLKKIFG